MTSTASLSFPPQPCNTSYLQLALRCLDPCNGPRIEGPEPTIASAAARASMRFTPVVGVVKPCDVAKLGCCRAGRKSSADAGFSTNAVPTRQSMIGPRRGWFDRAMAQRLTFLVVVCRQSIPCAFEHVLRVFGRFSLVGSCIPVSGVTPRVEERKRFFSRFFFFRRRQKSGQR